jgi:hypothetical protein
MQYRKQLFCLLTLAILICFSSGELYGQKTKKSKKKKGTTIVTPSNVPAIAKPGTEDLNKKVKDLQKIEGLFTFYRDTVTGSLFMLINKEQLGEKYIYFAYSENGPLTTRHNRGIFRDNKVFTIEQYYNRLEFVTQNTRFYFDSSSALYKAKDANIVPGMMASEKIVAENKEGTKFLISADNIFIKEALHQVKPAPAIGIATTFSYSLGSLNVAKTRYQDIRSYPENTDVIVRYVYEDPFPRTSAGAFVAEARYTEVILQHSFLKLPDDNFKPRFDDQRIGYFTTQINDMTSKEVVNYRDFIHRWRLEKKDPNAALSEPVKPITWWLENTTPVEYRPIITKALLAWNKSFEKAGFKNAIVVEQQPDSADWDAGDIRYNVIRWTSSANPPFGGYGPSFVNPLTGEILGADIMIEFVFLTNRLHKIDLFDVAALPNKDPLKFMENLGLSLNSHEDEYACCDEHFSSCQAGSRIHQQTMLGMAMNKALGMPEAMNQRFVEEALYYLILHETGHTLGLSHNMRASQYLSPAELQDFATTQQKGVIASVMEYPALNYPNEKGRIVQQYNTNPGPYDDWVIEYGYSPALENETEETNRLNKILARSVEPELVFGNDADDMRSPGKGIDPRVNIFDLSNDAITYASDRMKLIERTFKEIHSKYADSGKTYHELRNAYLLLTGEYTIMADVVSRYIGGVEAERFLSGQKENHQPLKPTPAAEQKRAMKLLADKVFAPEAPNIPTDILPFLQPQRRGFGFFANTEDPKLHERTLSMQATPLNHILAPSTLRRISNSRMYGNTYTLNELFNDLNKAIFAADIQSNINSTRQNLQLHYLNMLDAMLNSPVSVAYDNLSKARVVIALQDIRKMAQNGIASGNDESKNHKKYLVYKVEEILEKNKK